MSKEEVEVLTKVELEIYIANASELAATVATNIENAKQRLLTMQTANVGTLDQRFNLWNDSGVSREKKTMSELKGTIIGKLLSECLADGCVNRYETKTADCILDIIYDYNGSEDLSAENTLLVEYLMEQNIGEITFE
jgi:hypothetical protein